MLEKGDEMRGLAPGLSEYVVVDEVRVGPDLQVIGGVYIHKGALKAKDQGEVFCCVVGDPLFADRSLFGDVQSSLPHGLPLPRVRYIEEHGPRTSRAAAIVACTAINLEQKRSPGGTRGTRKGGRWRVD